MIWQDIRSRRQLEPRQHPRVAPGAAEGRAGSARGWRPRHRGRQRCHPLRRCLAGGPHPARTTAQDQKENFINKPKTRLINPAKNEIGRISKVILDNINKELVEKLKINQWKSSSNVLNWFKTIKKKHECKFIVFDIEQFYPSIKESVLIKALDFAKKHTRILKNIFVCTKTC